MSSGWSGVAAPSGVGGELGVGAKVASELLRPVSRPEGMRASERGMASDSLPISSARSI